MGSCVLGTNRNLYARSSTSSYSCYLWIIQRAFSGSDYIYRQNIGLLVNNEFQSMWKESNGRLTWGNFVTGELDELRKVTTEPYSGVLVYLSKITLAVHIKLSTAKLCVNSENWNPHQKNVDHPWSTLFFTSSSSSEDNKILNLCCCQARDIQLRLFHTKETPPLSIYFNQWDFVDWRCVTSDMF
jgi:hypothetical protein